MVIHKVIHDIIYNFVYNISTIHFPVSLSNLPLSQQPAPGYPQAVNSISTHFPPHSKFLIHPVVHDIVNRVVHNLSRRMSNP